MMSMGRRLVGARLCRAILLPVRFASLDGTL
jgi:hypothetical protein